MSVVVDLDLVVPAVISTEFSNMKCLRGYKENKKSYLNAMTISLNQIMNYALRMRSWDLGRVVVNFEREDVSRYLHSNPDIFVQIDPSEIYSIRLNYYDGKEEEAVVNLINEMKSKINYSPRVLRTVGLLED